MQRNANRLFNLVNFLINKDRNVVEGLKLIDEALEQNPDNFNYLDAKGWGLFKQGDYEEAQKFINRSDSLKPIYNHRIFLHKQEIEKVIAESPSPNMFVW